jgi:hypothetical protein
VTDDQIEIWESGFAGHETEQIRRLARLSFGEKLAWLEEAHRFVLEMEKARAAAAAGLQSHMTSSEK